MKALKRITALMLMLSILILAFPVVASAAGGTCGANLSWSLDSSGTLTISGSGTMANYDYGSAPWFEYVDSIQKVVINYGVTNIGNNAFAGCGLMTSASMPVTVIKIGKSAFMNCVSLTQVTLPSNLGVIEDSAFTGCGMTEIRIPDSVYDIGDYAFNSCFMLERIVVDSNNLAYSADSNGILFDKNKTVLIQAPLVTLTGKYTIAPTVTKIQSGAFAGCMFLTEVSIHAGVTAIGETAFNSCLSLQKITVDQGNSVYSSDAFGVLFNKSKTELIQAPVTLSGNYTIPASVEKIGKRSFELTELTSVVIPGNVKFIREGAFQFSDTLRKVLVVDGVYYIEANAFCGCTNLETVRLPDSVVLIGETAFALTAITDISLPDRELHIMDGAFYGCEKLKSITIPESVASIGMGAFEFCTGLTSAIIGGVETIEAYTFYECKNLSTVKIGEGIEKIEFSAFGNCEKLTSVELPRSLKAVYLEAFKKCDRLITVFYKGKKSDKDGINQLGGVDNIFAANWHYECVELQGKYGAYYCGECDQCFFLDNTQSHFTDVLTNNWQFTYAKYAVDNGLMAGVGKDAYDRVTFNPDRSISREEFVQVLYNAEDKPTVTIDNIFPDVADGGWYKNAVLWAKENNIANGIAGGSFGIGRNITRQDLALMLYKYASLKGYDLTATEGKIYQYADGSQVSTYAKEAMNWAVTNGILNGKGTSGNPLSTFRLDPAGTATRAECAAMLKNFISAFEESKT